MRVLFSYGLIVLLLCVQLGCGFHLRKKESVLSHNLSSLALLSNNKYDPFMQLLMQKLKSQNVDLTSAPTSCATLSIGSQAITSRPLAYGPTGELHRERIQLTVTYQFTPLNSQDSVPSRSIIVERDRQLNIRQDLGDWSEKQMIITEMQRDAIDQLIRQLNALSEPNNHGA